MARPTVEPETEVVRIRRLLHQYPEPAWCEFYTTQLIVEELEKVGVDDIYLGADSMDLDERSSVPGDAELTRWLEKAKSLGMDETVIEHTTGGRTGAVGVATYGDGPVVGVRVDIDGLKIDEPRDDDHIPFAEGFRSDIEGWMHACGHDANTAIGIRLFDRIQTTDFDGTLKVFFQPASEVGGGAKPMAYGPLISDVEYMFNVKVGIGYPTGQIVAGIDDMFAYHQFEADFTGEQAHYSVDPHEGANAVEALATAIQSLYSIHRHGEGQTRLNVAIVEGGSALAVLPETASMKGELRGETTTIMEYMKKQMIHRSEKSAELHNCDVDISTVNEGPSSGSDEEIVRVLSDVASDHPHVDSVIERDSFDSADDGSHFLEVVKANGGYGAFSAIGSNLPSGHHTRTFDIDEESLDIGIDVLATTIGRIGK